MTTRKMSTRAALLAATMAVATCGQPGPELETEVRGKADEDKAAAARKQIPAAQGCRDDYKAALKDEFDIRTIDGRAGFMVALDRFAKCLSGANAEAVEELSEEFDKQLDEDEVKWGGEGSCKDLVQVQQMVPEALPWECKNVGDRLEALRDSAGSLCQGIVFWQAEALGWLDANGQYNSFAAEHRANALALGCYAVMHDAATRLISRYYYNASNEDVSFDGYEVGARDVNSDMEYREGRANVSFLCQMIAQKEEHREDCLKDGSKVLQAMITKPLQFMPEWARDKYQVLEQSEAQ